MNIKEIIVVEGKDDTTAIKRAVGADTIETNGSAVSEQTIEVIRHAQAVRGVIIFTDPDYPGQRIRNIVSEKVPGCKHAFLPKEAAIAKGKRGLGVEHASDEEIRKALCNVYEVAEAFVSEIDYQDLVDAGLIGGSKAKARRMVLGKLLKIGYTNGKQLYKRLQMFNISKEQFSEALQQMMQEEMK
ncbi:MAG: ribonuclease M5 [Bacillaceae bacterium]